MKISVIIPAYNAEKSIRKTIDSIVSQDFFKKDLEIVVVNDGSTDKTLKILKSYGNAIKIINNRKNQGAVKSANIGFKAAKGEYVIKLDSDDVFLQGILKEMAEILDKESEVDFIYCDYYEKSSEGKIKAIFTKNIFNTLAGGVMFRKKLLAKEGFYNENISFAEYDLLLRVKDSWRGFRINKPLFAITGEKTVFPQTKNGLRRHYSNWKKSIPTK